MKQIIQSYKNGKIDLAEVPEPAVKAGGLLVRTAASLISPGTEKLMIEMGRKSLMGKARARPDLVRQAWAKARKEGFISVFKEAMNRLDEPIPLGYSAAGVVLEVGQGGTGFRPGDRVAAAGAGFASHGEVLWVPENLCVPIPEGVDFEAAAFVMLGAIALHGVRQAGLTLGETGVVIGLGLLGLLSVQMLAAQGCRVIGVDLDPQKVKLARELGAEAALVPGSDNVEEAIANFTGGKGADGVIIAVATQDNRPLQLAEAVARERARLVLVGVADISLTRKAFWEKELIFTVSKAAGPGSLEPLYEAKGFDYPLSLVRWTERRNLAAFLDLVARGRVRVDRLITHRFPIADALKAYDLIVKNHEPYIGVVLNYPTPTVSGEILSLDRKVFLKSASSASEAERLAVGLIGGGMFTKNILLPILNKIKGAHLVGVATTAGVSAHHLARKYGFAYATTDYRQILQDTAIGSVIITTRHNLHAQMVVEALAAGKHVFVEKPLCLTEVELEQIRTAYDGSRMVMVGFNRRFAPLAQLVKSRIESRTTPLALSYRVNAGFIPGDHWVHDPQVGGGRLLGEVCHFIDFLHYMTDSQASRVSVESISGALGKYRPDDNICITLAFVDGSIGSIIYSAKGTKTYSRERFEVFGDEAVGMIEDFRKGQISQGAQTQSWKKFSMDMGYHAELTAFFLDPVSEILKLFDGYASATRTTLKAAESLNTGLPVLIPAVTS
jgi:predicted dehydrogenase/threonine dehydrogenase-like Zn-dependent dehydrogenase